MPKKKQFFFSKLSNRLKSLLLFTLVLILLISVLFKFSGLTFVRSPLLNNKTYSEYHPCQNIVEILERPEKLLKYLVCPYAIYEFSSDPELGGLPKRTWHFKQLESGQITAAELVDETIYVGGTGFSEINLENEIITWYSKHNSPMKYVAVTDIEFDQKNNQLWIGTWGQLFRFDIQSKSMLPVRPNNDSEIVSVNDILITPYSLYILDQGKIHKLDNSAQNWQSYDESVFGTVPGEWSESLSSQLLYTQGKVYLLEPSDMAEHPYSLWYSEDAQTMNWRKFSPIMEQIKRDFPILHGNRPTLELWGSNNETGDIIISVSQNNDTSMYYFNVTKAKVGIARKDVVSFSAAKSINNEKYSSWLHILHDSYENNLTFN